VNRLTPSPNILTIWNGFKPSVHVLGRFLLEYGRKRLDPVAKTLVATAPPLSDVTGAFIDRDISVERHHTSRDEAGSVGGYVYFGQYQVGAVHI
jgi:hypothetical protein